MPVTIEDASDRDVVVLDEEDAAAAANVVVVVAEEASAFPRAGYWLTGML